MTVDDSKSCCLLGDQRLLLVVNNPHREQWAGLGLLYPLRKTNQLLICGKPATASTTT